MAARALAASQMVPAPTSSSGNRWLNASMTRGEPGTVAVISTVPAPPSSSASATRKAKSAESTRTTGMTPVSRSRLRMLAFTADRLLCVLSTPDLSVLRLVNAGVLSPPAPLSPLQAAAAVQRRLLQLPGGHGTKIALKGVFQRHHGAAVPDQILHRPI